MTRASSFVAASLPALRGGHAQWYYPGHDDNIQQWCYVESCSKCAAVLKRRDWLQPFGIAGGPWQQVTHMPGSPGNSYYEDFLHTDGAGVVWCILCRTWGGRARGSAAGASAPPLSRGVCRVQ